MKLLARPCDRIGSGHGLLPSGHWLFGAANVSGYDDARKCALRGNLSC
jgi:hypothetical protein